MPPPVWVFREQNRVGTYRVQTPPISGQRRNRGCRSFVAERFGPGANGEAGEPVRDQTGHQPVFCVDRANRCRGSLSAVPRPVRPTARRSCCCTAGPIASTAMSMSPLLTQAGCRVIVPHLRGYGNTRFFSETTMRNGEPAALAVDIIALTDALKVERTLIGGFDRGARTANIIASLWPERCKARVSVRGYLISSQEAGKLPLPPQAERMGCTSSTSPPSASIAACRSKPSVCRRHRRRTRSGRRGEAGKPRPAFPS
jgi:hypothetical protein